MQLDSAMAFTPKITADGSFTFFSEEFGEGFHSTQGAQREARLKFVEPTGLCSWSLPEIAILDICYGLGYNTAAALQAIWQINPRCRVFWIGLEQDVRVPRAAIAHQGLATYPTAIQTLLTQLAETHWVNTETFSGRLLLGEARQSIQQIDLPLAHGLGFHAIFLDPFSPPRCPQLWSVEFIQRVAAILHPQGRLATYSCAAAVRQAMTIAGLTIAATMPFGRRSPGTLASWYPTELGELSQREQEQLLTKAAIPYRDPSLTDDAAAILARRQQEQAASELESTTRWKKRWADSQSPIAD